MQSTRNNSSTLIPLSVKQKVACMTALKATNVEALSEALIAAALPPLLHSFPGAMQARLGLLQEFYRTSPAGSEMPAETLKLIAQYMQKEGIAEFIKILNQVPIEESLWNTSLLEFLAERLGIKINAEPVVQATIQAGKVYWRVMINNVVVHDRPAIKHWNVTFTEDNSWILDWKLFREFKDSGKRYSPVQITQERFAQSFLPDSRMLADAIWLELTARGILSHKHRLTHHWRALSVIDVKLNAIESMQISHEMKIQWYSFVNQVLFSTANNHLFAEKIEGVQDALIFRPERTHKSWAGTGKVKQDPIKVKDDQTRTKVYSTQRWDVAVHHELNSYRDSVFEKLQYMGVIMNYDHEPSSSILKNTESPLKASYDNQIANIDAQLAHYARHGYPTTKYNLRSNALSKEDLIHNQTCAGLEAQKKFLQDTFIKEAMDWAYCITIPKELHKHSDTTMESKGGQLTRSGNPFLADVTTNLNRLKKEPNNYGIKLFDDYLHALGAFRFLYRVQSKPATAAIANQVPIGRLASTFFQNPKDKDDLDKFFTQDVKEFISKREGLKK